MKDSFQKQQSIDQNPIRLNYNNSFLQKRKLKFKQQQQKRQKLTQKAFPPTQSMSPLTKKPQKQTVIPKTSQQIQINFHPNIIQQIPSQIRVKISAQQIIKNGKILKVVEKTLTPDQFKVQCIYQGQTIQIIVSKDQILSNSVIPMLDYYQKKLNIRN